MTGFDFTEDQSQEASDISSIKESEGDQKELEKPDFEIPVFKYVGDELGDNEDQVSESGIINHFEEEKIN